MPLYFAYGSNMDVEAMARRCPRAKPLGLARLARHQLAIMREGWLTAVRDPRGDVHGVLWDIAFADMRALDQYEQLASGLYAKALQPVIGERGAKQALIYFGANCRPRRRRSRLHRRRAGGGAPLAAAGGDDRPARILRRRGGRRPLRGVGGRRARPTRASALRHAVRPGLNGPSPAGAVAGLMDNLFDWLAVWDSFFG